MAGAVFSTWFCIEAQIGAERVGTHLPCLCVCVYVFFPKDQLIRHFPAGGYEHLKKSGEALFQGIPEGAGPVSVRKTHRSDWRHGCRQHTALSRSGQWWRTPGFRGWVSPRDRSEKSRILRGTAPTPRPPSPLGQAQHSPGCNVGTSYVLTSRGPVTPRSQTRRGSTCRQDNGGSPLSLCPFLTLPSYSAAPRAEPHTGRSSRRSWPPRCSHQAPPSRRTRASQGCTR